MTNGEKLRAMNDEQLGVWLSHYINCGSCPAYKGCKTGMDCIEHFIKWLGEEDEELPWHILS